jgi:hypothetical protein
MLFPWTRARWRKRVPTRARELANRPLIDALKAKPDRLVILTAGFKPIVEPLVAALGFPDARIIAARLASFADRRSGKLHAAEAALGREAVASSLVVTDSLDDSALLARCTLPLRTIWPEARFRRALAGVYLPGQYISQVKRPGAQYIARVIVQEDLVFSALSSVFVAAHPWPHLVGLTFLLASFWAIYERGYVDNDWAAAHLEHDGKLTASFWQSPVATPPALPWVWAIALGAVGVCVIEWPAAKPADFLKWLAVLVSMYLTFKFYNRIDKSTRVWPYAALQLARAAGFVPLVLVPVQGAIALAALALARWVPYYMYRLGGNWPEVHPNLMRLAFFVILEAVFTAAKGTDSLLTWTAGTLLFWNVFRARTELIPVLRRARFISRNQVRSPKEGRPATS